MSFNSAHRLLFRTIALLLVPAVLVVGANFAPGGKSEVQELSFHKVTLKNSITQPQTVVFEADEEFEDDSLTDAAFAYNGYSRIQFVSFTQEFFHPNSYHFPASQSDHPLNSRAPPVL